MTVPSLLLIALAASGCQGVKDTGFPTTAPPGAGDSAAPDSAPADSGETGETAAPPEPGWRGEEADAGFGHALAWDGERLYAGAPWGEGRVYALGEEGIEEGVTALVLAGEPALGVALAVDGGDLVAGAPLSGGGLLATADGALAAGEPGEVLGGRLMMSAGGLVATTSAGLWRGGERIALGARPGGLAERDGALVAGLPRGESALWIEDGDEGILLARPGARDEAGYALCAADLDGDGGVDLAVGAPGAGRVYLLLGDPGGWELSEAPHLEGGGRFGHALACAEGALFVGDPMYGEDLQGAVWAFEGDPTGWSVGAPAAAGEHTGGNLGAALLWTGEALFAGAPGADEGRVLQVLPQQ